MEQNAMWSSEIRVKAWQLLGILIFGAALGGLSAASATLWVDALIR